MKKATFTKQMYQTLVASVIRPGVGTITDSLLSKSKVFLYYESENLEMKENAKLIDKAGLGIDSISIRDAWNNALSFMSDMVSQQQFKKNVSLLNINGAREAAKILVSSLGD